MAAVEGLEKLFRGNVGVERRPTGDITGFATRKSRFAAPKETGEPPSVCYSLIEKIRSLSPQKAAEVEDFVDFLRLREEESRLTLAGARLSEEAFAEVWDNPEDAELR